MNTGIQVPAVQHICVDMHMHVSISIQDLSTSTHWGPLTVILATIHPGTSYTCKISKSQRLVSGQDIRTGGTMKLSGLLILNARGVTA